MAYYAIQHGWKTRIADLRQLGQLAGFRTSAREGVQDARRTIDANITITPGQSSYNAELAQAFSNKPQVIFDSMDSQSAATLFADGQQLGYMNIPWIGDDLQSAPNGDYAKAFGSTASTELTAALPASPAGTAYSHFLADYQKVWHTKNILPTTFNEYDSVVIASLAMTAANSTNPKVWVKDVVKVSDPPGVQCSTYASCVSLIKKGKDIDYQGASGNDDFNKYHNVFSGFEMLGFDSSLNNADARHRHSARAAVGSRERGLDPGEFVDGRGWVAVESRHPPSLTHAEAASATRLLQRSITGVPEADVGEHLPEPAGECPQRRG